MIAHCIDLFFHVSSLAASNSVPVLSLATTSLLCIDYVCLFHNKLFIIYSYLHKITWFKRGHKYQNLWQLIRTVDSIDCFCNCSWWFNGCPLTYGHNRCFVGDNKCSQHWPAAEVFLKMASKIKTDHLRKHIVCLDNRCDGWKSVCFRQMQSTNFTIIQNIASVELREYFLRCIFCLGMFQNPLSTYLAPLLLLYFWTFCLV